MALQTYRDLEAWKKSIDLVESVYRIAADLPSEEKYGPCSQIRRAAVSVPSNVAEGYGRSHRGDYLHHLSIARGSLAEVETLLTIAVRLGFLRRESVKESWGLAQETGRILNKLIASLRSPKDARAKSDGDCYPEP